MGLFLIYSFILILLQNTNLVYAESTHKGIGLGNPTNVYQTPSRDAQVLKSYKEGSILQYESHSSSWYSATVYVNGEKMIGYINKSDVDNLIKQPEKTRGIALTSSTNVHEEPTTSSSELKSYSSGTILQLETYSTNWYKARVYAAGEWRIGYIAASDVEATVNTPDIRKGVALKSPTAVYPKASTGSKPLKTYSEGTILLYNTFSENWFETTVYVNGTAHTGYIHKSHVDTAVKKQESQKGVALNSPTAVYPKASTGSKPLKTYTEGTILLYNTFSENWFETTVYVNGTAHTGYIHKSHVDTAVKKQESQKGVALNSPTAVYPKASTGSKPLKTYSEGKILLYNTFSENWFETTVYVDGTAHTGYIHKSHVETALKNQESLKGVGLKNPTAVYEKASTNSKPLKTYSEGTILLYNTFSENWFETTVYVNGTAYTGYIRKSHVDTAVKNQESLKGVGLKNPTVVYQKASTGSKSLKTYSEGSILLYNTFSENWFETTVYVNGKPHTGYIHKSHVDTTVDKQVTVEGIGVLNPTNVYSKPSINSSSLKSYTAGEVLVYKTFSTEWYQATVYINGEQTTGYIHHSHVEETLPDEGLLEGRSLKKQTNVYANATRDSSILKSYSKDKILKFRTLSRNWYQATVYIDGKPIKGYINVNDLSVGDVLNISKYDYSLKTMVDIQMTKSPKADGAGNILATRESVEFYVDPSNFSSGTKEYFQFLNLSHTAGLSAQEINNKVLYNKGILKGTGEAFIEAGTKFNINEAYLIAHTLHETGNGKSTLSNGIPVDKNGNVTRDSKGNIVENSKTVHIVYNMYGYGAYDDTPIDGGAKYAFNQKWFSPSSAIVGGAEDVAKNYINKGQNTLYKMRWNPDNPGVHQYATHVAWASIQTNKISEIYDLLDDYILVYDVPQFTNRPDESSDLQLTYPKGVYGLTQTSGNLNIRNGPSTNNSVIQTVPNNTRLEVEGQASNGWYKVKLNNKTGWVSNNYVNLLNLIQVTATGLNVRESPNGIIKGVVSNELITGVLNENNQLIQEEEWYKIYYNDQENWISGGKGGNQYLTIIK